MKRLLIVIALVLILGLGTLVIVWLNAPSVDSNAVPPVRVPSESVARAEMPDRTIVRVNLCDLVRDGKRWDRKFVSMQVVYVQGIDTSAFVDPRCEEAWARPACYGDDESCERTWKPLNDAFLHGRWWRIKVDVVGRYIADVSDPDPNQGGNHVHMIEVTSLKNPVRYKSRI